MIRKAVKTDLDFMIQIDLKDEGITTSDSILCCVYLKPVKVRE
ncbi:hypothetical protein [Paenibacillus stellifer]|nr:hypothetical protein [Paenibacillus stellifer]